ncbi:hypothetical protein BU23DRAFT_596596 [Bimuria novae-zelandiae CBS 107.79]|uniref:Uncharacterized protein n=1 Tax=Bimuria novae-zelandiae CBS 107.79 TaxID=1447943 RepID=A0A6A5VQA4_9PLEO|nr:hypothetical protein BU23DRAFT_596596 [Bimuria novae-zelandiae CBS 107.79]
MTTSTVTLAEHSLHEADDLTRFAGCTTQEWHLPKNTNTKSRFKQNLLVQITRETPRSDSLLVRMRAVLWAKEFILDEWDAVRDGPFVGTLAKAAYKEDARGMTKQLADLVNCFFFTWLRNCLRRKISQWWDNDEEYKSSATSQPFRMQETERFAKALEPDTLSHVEQDYADWQKVYRDIYSAIHHSETWRRLGQRVGTFCRDLGCPDATDDAHVALSALRQYNLAVLRDTYSWEVQVELKTRITEIQKLKDQLELYQKAIACLSFRSLLENLPEPEHRYSKGQKPVSATAHWKDFLAAAKDEAKSGGNSQHPLYKLVTEQPSTVEDGTTMYSTLSNNIHGFSQNLNVLNHLHGAPSGSEFAIKSIHFDPGKFQFLSAMVPIHFKPDGSVNIDKERKRYRVVWDAEKENRKENRQGGVVAQSKYKGPAVQTANSQLGKENQPPTNTTLNTGPSNTQGGAKQVLQTSTSGGSTATQPKAKQTKKK